MKKIYVGIDVSKDSLAIAVSGQTGKHLRFVCPNTEDGIKELIGKLPAGCHCTLEATGMYSRLAAYMIHGAGIEVSVINPKQYAYFSKMLLQATKSDPIDAVILSMYGERMKPSLFRPESRKILEIKHKFMLMGHLRMQYGALDNIGKAMQCDVVCDAATKERLEGLMHLLEGQLKEIEAEICQSTEQEFAGLMALATSVPGIGDKTASQLIIATNGLKNFDSPKQLSKFLGLAPVYRQSGTSVNYSAGINRSGNPHLRALLYMCTWTAIRYNNACKEMYQRLKANGKPSKVALIAVANKLIRQIFAVVKSGLPFNQNYSEKLEKAH